MAGYLGTKPTRSPLTTADLADNIVTNPKLADNAVGTAELVDGLELGGPSLGTNHIIRTNALSITSSITFAGTENGMTIGPVTVSSGVVTVTSPSTWTII